MTNTPLYFDSDFALCPDCDGSSNYQVEIKCGTCGCSGIVPNEYRLVLSFAGFSYGRYYLDEERLLTPQLKAMGYTNISWSMGEADSFGPPTRTATMTNPDGKRVRYVYG